MDQNGEDEEFAAGSGDGRETPVYHNRTPTPTFPPDMDLDEEEQDQEIEDSPSPSQLNFNILDLPSTSAEIRVFPHAAELLREEREKQAKERERQARERAERDGSGGESDLLELDFTGIGSGPYDLLAEDEDEEVDEEEDEAEIAARERAFTNGNDWRYKIPFNKDGSYTYCKDISTKGNWTLSSCKSGAPFPFSRGSQQNFDGYGIDELLDDDVDKYWQSDGPQPHSILVEFDQKVDISFIMLYLDFKNDESYTPAKIIVQLGHSLMHLDDGRDYEFNEPVGWQIIDLRDVDERPSRTFVILLQVVQNHQNGRDTHIRHIRLASPIKPLYDPVDRMQQGGTTQEGGSKNDIFRDDAAKKLNKKFMNSLIIR